MGFMTLHGAASRPLPTALRAQPSAAERAPQATAGAASRASVVPTAAVHSPTLSMANSSLLYMRNPMLGRWSLGKPMPRSSFSLPVLISPDATPQANALFEEPADPAKKHYLARYAVATVGSGGAQSYGVSFAANAEGFVLTVQLADVTDAALVSNATRIEPTTTRYVLTANLEGLAATWDFGTASSDASTLTLTLTVTDPASRDSIYRAMTDASAHAQLIVRRSLEIAVPAASAADGSQPLYRESLTAVDLSIAFTFDPVLDKNVFALLGGVGTGQSTWSVTQVPYAPDNRSFPYYWDARQPSHVYYLPDTFQVGRQQSPPHAPNITITTGGSDPASPTFTFSFLALPVWNPDRIANAAAWWQNYLKTTTPPDMHLFEASNTGLQLTLPAADGSGSPALVTQAGAIIDIAGGINCSVTLALAQLQQVYAALFDKVSQLLSGIVTVTVDSDVESIHFSWRAEDFAGGTLDTMSAFDPEQSQFTVVVSNSLESPVHVDSLPAAIMKGPIDPKTGRPSTKVQDLGQTLSPTPPVDLTPPAPASGGTPSATPTGPNSITLQMRMLPQGLGELGSVLGQTLASLATQSGNTGQNAAGDCVVVIDFGHTTVKPDPAAIWDAIMSNQVVGPVQRNVKVMAFASMFSAANVRAVQVVFENGQTIDFNSSTQADASGLMTQTVTLAVPVKAFVLGTGDTSYYTYRIDLVSATGTQQGQWVSSNTDSFYVQTGG